MVSAAHGNVPASTARHVTAANGMTGVTARSTCVRDRRGAAMPPAYAS